MVLLIAWLSILFNFSSTKNVKRLLTNASKTCRSSIGSIDFDNLHNFWGFVARQNKSRCTISRFDMEVSIYPMVQNYNFQITPIIYIDNACSYVGILECFARARCNLQIKTLARGQCYVSSCGSTFLR